LGGAIYSMKLDDELVAERFLNDLVVSGPFRLGDVTVAEIHSDAEYAELQRDALRYRHIRNKCIENLGIRECGVFAVAVTTGNSFALSEDELNVAVDAEIAALGAKS
jgi:hypothetical protein